VSFTILADRDRWGPAGLFGGEAGARAHYILNPDTNPQVLSSKSTISLAAGDVVSIQSTGGGGYGPAFDRDPDAVLRDVIQRRVSSERAADLYGVAVDNAAGTVDGDRTAALRARPA
jgi:N-methylhydantoinase B